MSQIDFGQSDTFDHSSESLMSDNAFSGWVPSVLGEFKEPNKIKEAIESHERHLANVQRYVAELQARLEFIKQIDSSVFPTVRRYTKYLAEKDRVAQLDRQHVEFLLRCAKFSRLSIRFTTIAWRLRMD